MCENVRKLVLAVESCVLCVCMYFLFYIGV